MSKNKKNHEDAFAKIRSESGVLPILPAVEEDGSSVEDTDDQDPLMLVLAKLESLEQRLGVIEGRAGVTKNAAETESFNKVHDFVSVSAPGEVSTSTAEETSGQALTAYEELIRSRQRLVESDPRYRKPAQKRTGVDTSSRLRSLIGSHVGIAQTTLTNMRVQGAINSYQVVPIGSPAPNGASPGRVLVSVDAGGTVIDVAFG